MAKKFIYLSLLLVAFRLGAEGIIEEFRDYRNEETTTNVANDLVYGEGTTEITSSLNEYDPIIANQPIRGSIFVTHNAKDKIDVTSFRLGEKPLAVIFVSKTQISSDSNLIVAIFSFTLDGLPLGVHTLPSINVKVAGKVVQALPLVVEVTNQNP